MDEEALNPEIAASSPRFETRRDAPRWRGLALTYVIVAGVVVVGIALPTNIVGWLFDQVMLYTAEPVSAWSWPVLSAGTALLVAVFCVPMLFMRRMTRVFVTGYAWLAACAAMAAFGLVRVIPVANGQLSLAVQAIAFSIVAGALWLMSGRFRTKTTEDRPKTTEDRPQAPGAFWLALCAGGVTALPWAWLGALGGLGDTVLAAVAALAFGAVAAFVLGDRFWSAFTTDPPPDVRGAVASPPRPLLAEPDDDFESPRPDSADGRTEAAEARSAVPVSGAVRVWGGGGAAGVALLLLGASVGGPGIQLPVMIVLAGLGFAVAAVASRSRHTGRIVGAAVAPAVFGPLAFIDDDEFILVLSSPEIAAWVGQATIVAVLAAWVIGVGYGLSWRRIVGYPSVAAGVVVLVAAAGVGINGLGQPGFHGEKVLVVLAEQADLSGIEGDRESRLAEVHERLVDSAESAQRDLRSELDDRGLDYRPFYLINAIEVDTGLFARSWLTGRDDVAEVLLSPQLRPVPEPGAVSTGGELTGSGPQPNIEQIGAPQAWERATGEGITIGISDSGVDGEHPAFADRFRGGGDSWADPVNGTREPNDPNGHGTHALGLALGSDGIGVAPGADWVGCANLPRNAANPADYLACLEFMLAPYPNGGDPLADGDPLRAPHVLTNSWGCPAIEGCDATVLNGAVRAFEAAGVFFTVATGNSGPACGSAKTPPANAPDAYSVGAVNEDGELAPFSSRGPVTVEGRQLTKPEISAPGVDVVSALPGGGYGPNTGTSMAGPHVAGAVALLWSANEELIGDVAKTRDILNETAAPVTETQGSSAIDGCGGNPAGAGTVDVAAAIAETG